MKETPGNLRHLYEALTAALSEKSISYDKRNRFKPHITLARHSSRPGMTNLQPVTWNASHLVLVKSRFSQGTKGNHPQYIPIAERMLGN